MTTQKCARCRDTRKVQDDELGANWPCPDCAEPAGGGVVETTAQEIAELECGAQGHEFVGGGDEEVRCKLCGASSAPTTQPAIEQLAAAGVSEETIREVRWYYSDRLERAQVGNSKNVVAICDELLRARVMIDEQHNGWSVAIDAGERHLTRAKTAETTIAARDERVKILEETLREAHSHMYHAGDCFSRVPMSPPRGFHKHECNCGRDEARAAIVAALRPPTRDTKESGK